jgi:hypothetical protein
MPRVATPRAHLSGDGEAGADALNRPFVKGQRNDNAAFDAIGGIFSEVPHRPTHASLTRPGRPGGRSVSLPRHMLRTVKDGL